MFTAFTSTEEEKVRKGLWKFEKEKKKELVLTKKKSRNVHYPVNSRANLEYKDGVDLSKYG